MLIQRLKGETSTLDVNSDEDWPSVAALEAKGWDALLVELAANQTELIGLLATKTDALLPELSDGKSDFRFLIEGIIQHDVYHIGQIGLLLSFRR